jgi:hypothetical protein
MMTTLDQRVAALEQWEQSLLAREERIAATEREIQELKQRAEAHLQLVLQIRRQAS